jgi:hypothetical protein
MTYNYWFQVIALISILELVTVPTHFVDILIYLSLIEIGILYEPVTPKEYSPKLTVDVQLEIAPKDS